MCGIAGLIRADTINSDDVMAVERMISAQAHRGPDDCGIYSDKHVLLGHRRLSILDLSTAGHQPMTNEDSTVWVTFNGEIYNHNDLRAELAAAGHSFRSKSDTEVLIHGYEEWEIDGLLSRLRGMFAFGIYDSRQKLILARDRLGIKPLYYFDAAGILAFASEVGALERSGMVPDDADPEAVPNFLLFGSIPSPLTTMKAVRCLPAGHFLVLERGRPAVVKKYWSLPRFNEQSGACERIDHSPVVTSAQLQRAVSEHLISDVPLGVFLSGGVDSAAIVALAAKTRTQPLTTLTVRFAEQEFDESQHASEIAQRFRTHHHEILATAQDFANEIPSFLSRMDQPTNDGINTWFVSKAARKCGLSVVLSGLGADELFWGYGHYRQTADGALVRRVLSALPAIARGGLIMGAGAYGNLRGEEKWMRLSPLKRNISAESMYYAFRGFFSPQHVARLLALTGREMNRIFERAIEELRPPDTNGHFRSYSLNLIEIKRYLQDQLLRDTDNFSMAHSIEVRVPFLDHQLMEHCVGLPDKIKLDRALNKPVLIHAITDASIRDAGNRPKKGFSLPMDRWMKVQSGLLGEMARNAPGVDKREAAKMWNAFESGRLHWSRAWAMVVLARRHDCDPKTFEQGAPVPSIHQIDAQSSNASLC
jgi:asparagine synthase (glutamine-hydrolysing)